ncbi:RabGAP/TBC domain-containing protein [Tieghemostelium lacteum]|uniref:RabGAP/TBC domain-containing protein n=1 Tax=Tieghemostelium lacteum TaxID=361077 RepID=A0A151Z924_TIELA|nr:RabGAP/TBC domain-containing protein [Tieghemostelium lacteum]|eukprot:KYQ90442.1 RabGAP/TBC domain-containing protein [Tieghemostelium lacteum]
MQSQELDIENQIIDLLNKQEYSFEDWSESKRLIKALCENGVPNKLRYLIWKYIGQGDTTPDTSSPITLTLLQQQPQSPQQPQQTVPVISSPTPYGRLQFAALHKDCQVLTQDYNLLSQIRAFETNSDVNQPISPFLSTPTTTTSSSSLGSSSLLGSSGSSISTDSLNAPIGTNNYSALTSDQISDKLERFVVHFCSKTKRDYSSDVVKLLIPFVVLSIIHEKDQSKEQSTNTEQDWMRLSIKIIDIISNCGIHPYQIANQMLLCESEMFRILLLYHDPVLSYFLDQRSVYTTSYFYEWINHMFCGCIDIKFLIQLWDVILLHQHQDFYLYFALALLTSKKEYILSVKGVSKDILLVLEEKEIVNSLSNQLKLPALIKSAEQYRSITPLTFLRNWNKFYTYCKDPSGPKVESIKNIYIEYKYSVCMGIDVEELILASKYGKESKIKEKFRYYLQDEELQELLLFVFDCRPYKYYKCGKFPSSFHLPPGLLVSQPEEFERVSKSFIDMKGQTHFTFYDNWFQFKEGQNVHDDADTNDNGDMNMNILRFLKEGFPYVSRVPSGYKKIHDIFLSKSLELSVHLSDKCPVCNPELNNPPPENTDPKTPPLSSTTSKEKAWLSKLKSPFAKKSETTTTTTSPAKDEPPKKLFGLFRDKLKIGSSNSNSKSDGSLNESGELFNDSNGQKKSFYLPNLSPFILDDEESANDFYEEGKKFYYYIHNKDSEYIKELDRQFKEFLEMEDPIYDHEKVKSITDQMESELKGEYKGIDDWLDGTNLIFECTQVTFNNQNQINENRYIIITSNAFVSLKEHPKCAGYVKIDFQYDLEDIRRIVYKKTNPNLLEFRFSSKTSTIDTISPSHSQEDITSNNGSSTGSEIDSSTEILNSPSKSNLIKKCYLFNEIDPILKSIKERTD